jgi:hypothetical protein
VEIVSTISSAAEKQINTAGALRIRKRFDFYVTRRQELTSENGRRNIPLIVVYLAKLALTTA